MSLGLRTWASSSYRLLRSTTKPGRSEFWLLLRVCVLGVVIIGALGFVIRFVFALIQMGTAR